jgi:gluconokinase
VGATDAGTLAVNIGTSAAARMLTDQPQADVTGRLWTYVADAGHWVMGGIIGSSGAVYEWLLRKLLFADRDLPLEQLIQEADRLAADVPPGAGDLLFLPYFSGEQSPDWNPELKGLVYGLTFQHEPRHTIRAAVEGISFSLLRVARTIEAVRNTAVQTIYLTGGLTASPVWTRILTDVFGASASLPRSPESSARGAAILGWLTLGHGTDYEDFRQPQDLLYPDAENHAVYQRGYKRFCSLNHHLQAYLNEKETPRDYRIADP